MRILVFEFFSGGGLAGRDADMSIAREGAAMRDALVEDLAATGEHHVVVSVDERFPPKPIRRVEARLWPRLPDMLDSVDAVWLIAPETGRCLERLAAHVERTGKILRGPSASAIRRASDKSALPARLARCGVAHPATRVLNETDDCVQAARELGYPVVVKPVRGAGCEGVRLARDEGDLREAVAETRCELRRQAAAAREDRGPVVWRRVPELQDLARSQKTGSLLLQQYVRGVAASVSLLCDGRDAVAVAVNAQVVQIADDDAEVAATRVSYLGGQTPLDHPLAPQAAEAAVRACRAVAGLRGFVGVDVVVTDGGPIVIEINPRLTTAYLGVRRAVRENVAALALAACAGTLPAPPTIRRAVRFTSDGRVSFVSTSRHVAALCQARFETARPGDAPTGRLNRR